MKAIYLDNFRGFSSELISLEAINFLVGENSTGKTSFLAALKVLGSRRFWLNPSFNDPDLHFSSFSEIVSKVSSNKHSFTIGYYDDSKIDDVDNFPIFRLITFKNEEGVPVVHKYSFSSQIGLISTIISNGSIRYKVKANQAIFNGARKFLDSCVEEHSLGKPVGYKKIKREDFPRELFFANAYHFVVVDLTQREIIKNANKNRITFGLDFDMPKCRWIAPIRAKPEKIYLSQTLDYSSEGGHIPNLLNSVLGNPFNSKADEMIRFIKDFGMESGLFHSVSVKRFGKEASSPFVVNVNLGGNDLLLSNVGYGVSQVLPIVLEARLKSNDEYIAIQQPEVHLHPKAQAALGEFIYHSNKLVKNNFLIETHSDYLIDRFRLCTNKKGNINAQVMFFERTDLGNKIQIIPINSDGSYPVDQPKGFRSFFIKEEMDLLRL